MNLLGRLFLEPLGNFYESLMRFFPTILESFLILMFGIVLALCLKGLFQRIFRAVRLDTFLERSGLAELLKKTGLKEGVSPFFARFIGWLTFFVFALIAMNTLQIYAAGRLFEQFLMYLPHFFASLLILLVGYLLSNFLYRATLIAAVNAGNRFARTVSRTVKYAVVLLSATMALEQLGIGKQTVVIAFAIIFGGIILALAIAFGLGGTDLAKNYLEKRLNQSQDRDEIDHL
jgi:hypothetical protein